MAQYHSEIAATLGNNVQVATIQHEALHTFAQDWFGPVDLASMVETLRTRGVSLSTPDTNSILSEMRDAAYASLGVVLDPIALNKPRSHAAP